MDEFNIKIEVDENGNEFLDRILFSKYLVNSLKEGYDQFIVDRINSGSVVFKIDGELEELDVSNNEIDEEIQLLIYILVSSAHFSAPKILFHMSGESSTNLNIEGISILDYDGIMVSSYMDESNITYVLELGSRYLFNLLRQNGVFKLANTTDKLSQKLMLIPTAVDSTLYPKVSDEAYSYESNDILSDKVESWNPTAGSVNKERRVDKMNRRKIRLNRRKDPAGHRRRSRDAKLRWKRNRSKYITGMKKYHRSQVGKMTHRRTGKKNSLIAKSKR